LACQPLRKKPCVTATDGSVPVTMAPPGPVPTPVLTVVGVVLPPPPPFAGSFLHDCINAMDAAVSNIVFLMFFIIVFFNFQAFYVPVFV
jgi:hypothetical protein